MRGRAGRWGQWGGCYWGYIFSQLAQWEDSLDPCDHSHDPPAAVERWELSAIASVWSFNLAKCRMRWSGGVTWSEMMVFQGLVWPNLGPEDIDTNIKAVILCVWGVNLEWICGSRGNMASPRVSFNLWDVDAAQTRPSPQYISSP